MLWMCAGAVLDFAADIALLLAGLRQEPFASHLENDYHLVMSLVRGLHLTQSFRTFGQNSEDKYRLRAQKRALITF
jgi:hypothetical protein